MSLKTSRTGSQLGGGAGRGAEEGSGGGGVTEEEEEETLPGLSCQLNTAPLPTIECFNMFDKLISTAMAYYTRTFVILVSCLRGEERALLLLNRTVEAHTHTV